MKETTEDIGATSKERTVQEELNRIEAEINSLETYRAEEDTQEQLLDKINEYHAKSPKYKWFVAITVIVVGILFYVSYNIFVSQPEILRLTLVFIEDVFNANLISYILVGLAAQLVDGALGMAYGVTCSSFLLSLGVPQSVASTSVHVAEIFTTGASGLSHLKFGNVNKKLFKYLLIPGIAGAVIGAYLLSKIFNDSLIKPFISAYLLILGLIILKKALSAPKAKAKTKNIGWLAGFGGFMDAVGGGGWGPIVTSTLLSKGRSANYTIGSVNLAEFFIAIAGAGTFLIFAGVSGWQAIIGLVIGGIIASPLAALVVSKIKRKPLMLFVGLLIVVLSVRTLVKTDYAKLVTDISELVHSYI